MEAPQTRSHSTNAPVFDARHGRSLLECGELDRGFKSSASNRIAHEWLPVSIAEANTRWTVGRYLRLVLLVFRKQQVNDGSVW